ncbi:MAG: hypothetical protein GY928_32180 [Colwellia sp.]|nr:hypothetical protein [Colwellia sp.]
MIKSDFQKVLPEDSKQYREVSERYMKLTTENGTEAYDLMKLSWNLAQRWSEIQASTSKIAAMDHVDIMKTDFKAWAYQRYRQMQLIHESCRMIWGKASDYELFLRKSNYNGNRNNPQ